MSMRVQRKEIVSGRPEFTQVGKEKPQSTKSFMSENPLLRKLAPSAKPSKILEALKWLTSQFLKPFQIKSPDARKERLSRLIRPASQASLTFGNVVEQYQKYLKKEKNCAPSLKKCFDQMNRDLLTIGKIAQSKDSALGNKLMAEFNGKLHADFIKMKAGDARIFALQGELSQDGSLDAQLLCVITKQSANSYSLKFIGIESVMSELTGVKIPLAGKEKTIREIHFDKIPSESGPLPVDHLMNDLITAISEKSLSLNSIKDFAKLKNIEHYQKKEESFDDLATLSSKPSKLFWTVVHSITKDSSKGREISSMDEKRMKLRAEMLSLFETFHRNRRNLDPSNETFRQLKEALEMVSGNVLQAYEKQYLSKKDLGEITKELNAIEKSLNAAKQKTTANLAKISLPKPILKGLTDDVFRTRRDVNVTGKALNLGHRSDGVLPSTKMPAPLDEPVSLTPYDHSFTDKGAFLGAFRKVHQDWQTAKTANSRTNMLRFISELPLDVYEKKNQGKDFIRTKSFLWNLTKEESQEICKACTDFTKTISIEKDFRQNLSQYEFESIFKLSALVCFLETKEVGSYREYNLNFLNWKFRNYTRVMMFVDIQGAREIAHNFRMRNKSSANFDKEMNSLLGGMGKEFSKDGSVHVTYLGKNKDLVIEKLDANRDPTYPQSTQQRYLLEFLAGEYGESSLLYLPSKLGRWMRPIQNPFLIGLYRQAGSQVAFDFENERAQAKEAVGDRYGRMTPEAFQTDPEGIFRYFLEDINETMRSLERSEMGLSLPNELLKPAALTFTKEEQSRLLMLLRLEKPQVELVAFMQQNQNLMLNPDVRNFFHALFFNQSLEITLGSKSNYSREHKIIEDLPHQIGEEIHLLEAKIEESLVQDPISDLELMQSRFDLLLYYYDLHEQLKIQYETNPNTKLKNIPFEDFKPKVLQFLNLSLQRKELFDSAPNAARVYLRRLLRGNEIPAKDFPKVICSYLIAFGGVPQSSNIDPAFEQELQRNWPLILGAIEKNPEAAGGENLQGALDHFCYMRDLPLDGSPWEYQGNGLYSNAKYEVDLRSLKTSLRGEKADIKYLPVTVTSDPLFAQTFNELKDSPVRTNISQVDGDEIFTFKDRANLLCQVERRGGQNFMFKKLDIDGERWLQNIPLERLNPSPKLLEALRDLEEKNRKVDLKTIFKFLGKLLGIVRAEAEYPLPVLANGLYVDPKNKKEGFSINDEGKVIFKFQLKMTKKGVQVESVVDLRGAKPSSPMQVNHGAAIKHPALNALSALDNKQNITVWSSKGKLEKLEVTRLGLTFVMSDGRLKCQHPDFKDYYLNVNAPLQAKKGFPLAVVLEHPDPSKPKKLLVPDADALVQTEEVLRAEASGVGKIFLYIKQIIQLIRLIQGKEIPKTPSKVSFGIDPKLKNISFSTFDLRPYTGEICEKEKDNLSDLMQLVKQATKIGQADLAYEYFKKVPLENLDQNSLNSLTSFLQKTQVDKTGAEAAIKFKICLALKTALKKEKRLNKNMRGNLHRIALENGKAMLALGRKVPFALQMSEEDRLEFAHIAKQQEPEYFAKHLQAYFVKEGKVVDLTQPLEVTEDLFTEKFKLWKKSRPKVDLNTRIEALEKEIKPLQRLTDAELRAGIPRLEPGKEVPLLFTSDKVKNLFVEQPKVLPNLTLTSKCSTGTSCEKAALEEHQNDIDEYKSRDSTRPNYIIKASAKTLKRFLNKDLIRKKNEVEKELAKAQAKIEAEISNASAVDEQLAIYAKKQSTATFDELRIALTQGRLEELKNEKRLPSNLDINMLKEDLGRYFDLLSRKNAAEAGIKLIEEILNSGDRKNAEQWESLSNALHRLLTVKRYYSAKDDPRLVAFEAQQFINFKPLEGGLDQLSLLEALLKHPTAIIQAPTGAGKTSVLSVMRSLLKANGKNLVIQKVLPALYQQTYEKMQEVLGGLYGTAIYPLRFSLNMPLTKLEIVKEAGIKGEIKEVSKQVSIFKGMYHQMLETIQQRGCILTDYKSLPLLEEKFWKIGQELVEKRALGEPIDRITEEHYTYLNKILNLLEMKADENMDEFDQPNRPINKIQLELGVGSDPFPPFVADVTMDIYNLLLADKELMLSQNIQGELSEAARMKSIERAAEAMAYKLEAGDKIRRGLKDYFLGKNEDVLKEIEGRSPAFKDTVTLCKDQFSIYLPLTLRTKSPSRYARSDDGKRTLPCNNGEKHEAKFGTMLEQVNYTIQDYMQNGITGNDLKEWLYEVKGKFDSAKSDEQKPYLLQLEKVFPGYSFHGLAGLLRKEESLQGLIAEVNKDPEKVKFFLRLQLSRLKNSGIVISMDPQNSIDMSRTVSGTSATMGAPESLHRNFEVDSVMNGQIRANMLFRLVRRAVDNSILKYDPANPEKMLLEANKKKPIAAVIDGAGAFKDSSKKSAEKVLAVNPDIHQVLYFEGERSAFVGKPTGNLNQTGIFFDQAHTRGSDKPLPYDATAALTLGERDGIRDFFQKEGRLRIDTQRYHLSLSQYQEGVESLPEEISKAICNDALVDSQDIFRKSKQEFMAIIRKAARRDLLSSGNMDEFINKFSDDQVRRLFISPKPKNYMEAGSYFKAHKKIIKEDQPVHTVLQNYQNEMMQLATALNLPTAADEIKKIAFSKELLAKMPSKVAPIKDESDELNMELEVEQEQEQEAELEKALEMQMEIENENIKEGAKVQVGIYPLRTRNKRDHYLAAISGIPFDFIIEVSDSFMPLSRKGTPTVHQRDLFDAQMYRVGIIFIEPNVKYVWTPEGRMKEVLKDPPFNKIIIEDPLEDISYRSSNGFFYDIRTNKVVASAKKVYSKFDVNEALKRPEFKKMLAQIKFFDGRTSGYSEGELADLAWWLMINDPAEMRDHLLNTILRYRYSDKLAYSGSQLEELFEKLIDAGR